MASFSESLTVRILGDSSSFQQELDRVSQRVTSLQSQFSRFGETASSLSRLESSLANLNRPLQTVSRNLQRISGQLQGISRTPITLNVAPALNSLSVLAATANSVRAQVRSVSSATSFTSPGSNSAFPGYATGGYVQGPTGRDRVPAMLTAGEFVLQPQAVQQLGVGFLNALNQGAVSQSSENRSANVRTSPNANSMSTQQTVNNFGGISVHVRQPGDVNSLVRDLRFQGIRLQNRRG